MLEERVYMYVLWWLMGAGSRNAEMGGIDSCVFYRWQRYDMAEC